jgi:hypothetical protein
MDGDRPRPHIHIQPIPLGAQLPYNPSSPPWSQYQASPYNVEVPAPALNIEPHSAWDSGFGAEALQPPAPGRPRSTSFTEAHDSRFLAFPEPQIHGSTPNLPPRRLTHRSTRSENLHLGTRSDLNVSSPTTSEYSTADIYGGGSDEEVRNSCFSSS